MPPAINNDPPIRANIRANFLRLLQANNIADDKINGAAKAVNKCGFIGQTVLSV